MSAFAGGAIEWRWKRFEALSVHELQYLYMARQNVFVVEQACVFLDADGYDDRGFHLAAWAAGLREPLAYARALEPGSKYPADASIGRVLTTAPARGTGLGRELMSRAIAETARAWPGSGIRISAQSRLEAFYVSLGFQVAGERYLEDGIPHTEMRVLPAAG